HYARSAGEACYRDELDTMTGVRVLHGYTRSTAGSALYGRFGAEHLAAAMPEPDAVYVCGPPDLVQAVRKHCADARSESFVPPTLPLPAAASGARVTFPDSSIEIVDDGGPLLAQAEPAGLNPESGCRMGICHSCTRRKT